MLTGWKAIAKHCGVSVQTIRNWKEKHGFPVYELPSGSVWSSEELIHEWGRRFAQLILTEEEDNDQNLFVDMLGIRDTAET